MKFPESMQEPNAETHLIGIKNPKVRKWVNFSMAPHAEKEIETEYLKDKESVCISYCCRTSKFSEKEIERLAAITTNIVKDPKDTESINKIIALLYDGKESDIINGVKVFADKLNDRIDWLYISQYQNLSEKFIERHSKDVNWNLILQCQSNISEKFRKDHLKFMSRTIDREPYSYPEDINEDDFK